MTKVAVQMNGMKVRYRTRRWWKKCKELVTSLYMMEGKEGGKDEESRTSERRPQGRQTLGNFGKWLFLLLILEQNWTPASAAAEGLMRWQSCTRKCSVKKVDGQRRSRHASGSSRSPA